VACRRVEVDAGEQRDQRVLPALASGSLRARR
jgi:hypothetical protein